MLKPLSYSQFSDHPPLMRKMHCGPLGFPPSDAAALAAKNYRISPQNLATPRSPFQNPQSGFNHMKIKQILGILGCLATLLFAATSRAATLTKANTTTMNVAADWGGTAPAAGNVGQFTSTISAANEAALTLGGSLQLDSVNFLGTLNGPVNIGPTASSTFTLGAGAGGNNNAGGVDMSAANQDVTIRGNMAFDYNAVMTINVAS